MPPLSLDDDLRAHYDQLRDELDPESHVEGTLADEIAWASTEMARLRRDADPDSPGFARSMALAHRIFHKAHKDLNQLRDQARKAKQEEEDRNPPPKPEKPLPPQETPEALAEAAATWRDRIAYVPELNAYWPLLLKTGERVEHYVTFALDKLSDDDLFLIQPPGFDRLDLAACRACEAAGQNGPFDPDWNRPWDMRTLEGDDFPPNLLPLLRLKKETLDAGLRWPIPMLKRPRDYDQLAQKIPPPKFREPFVSPDPPPIRELPIWPVKDEPRAKGP
jgi:hypothetical protein